MNQDVFVNHAHVFPEHVNADGTIDRLLRLMDTCGIARAVCFAPFPHQIECGNKWLANEIRNRADQFAGFGTIDFRRDDVRDQVRRIHDLGFPGIKVHPNAQDENILAPRALETYAAAEELDLFLTFHTGVHRSKLSDTRVLLFDEIAWKFPKLRFSLEHVGGYHFFNEALAVLFNHVPPPWAPGKCNLFAGLSSVFSTKTNRFWYLSNERLRELIAQVPVTQLIFGLDFPYNKEEETLAGLNTIRNELDLTREQIDLVLGGNLARELATSHGHLARSS